VAYTLYLRYDEMADVWQAPLAEPGRLTSKTGNSSDIKYNRRLLLYLTLRFFGQPVKSTRNRFGIDLLSANRSRKPLASDSIEPRSTTAQRNSRRSMKTPDHCDASLRSIDEKAEPFRGSPAIDADSVANQPTVSADPVTSFAGSRAPAVDASKTTSSPRRHRRLLESLSDECRLSAPICGTVELEYRDVRSSLSPDVRVPCFRPLVDAFRCTMKSDRMAVIGRDERGVSTSSVVGGYAFASSSSSGES